MSERLVAWANLTSAARAFATSDNKETREALSREARTWAAIESPKREATGERSAVAGDGPIVRFGRNKDQRVRSLPDRDFEWYVRALRENINDPSRARYRQQNETHLKECLEARPDPGEHREVDEDMQRAHNARGW